MSVLTKDEVRQPALRSIGFMRTRLNIIIVVLAIVLNLSPMTVGESSDPDVVVEFAPGTVVMEVDEEASVHFTITNQGDGDISVAFFFRPLEAEGHTTGYFETSFTILATGVTHETDLVVRSHAEPEGAANQSDFDVEIVWGRDLELDDEGEALPGTVEGQWDRRFVVLDEEPSIYGPLPYLMLLAVVLFMAVFIFHPRWMMGTDDQTRDQR